MGTHSNMSSKQPALLSYQDAAFKDQLLANLNKLRRQKELCDAMVVVEAHEYPVHKAVLASASPYLFDVFKKSKSELGYKLTGIKDHDSFEVLLDYAYTGRLEIPAENVKAVYRVANHLKMADAVAACSNFLADSISLDNCLGIRQFAVDANLRETADLFIQENIYDIMKSKKFFGLPQIPVEIVGANPDLVESSNDKHMFELVLNWARANLDQEKPRLEDLTEQTNVLNLNTDSSLTDFANISDDKVKDEEGIVQDYKKTKKKLHPPKPKEGHNQTSPSGNVRKFSLSPSEPLSPKEWAIVACYQMKDKSYASVAMLNNKLVTISIHYRLSSVGNASSDEPDSPESEVVATQSRFFDSEASLTPLAVMSDSRCAFGLEAVDGKLIVCGGYDRSECLKSTETFDIHTNTWTHMSEMSVPRGRFSVTAVSGQVYAVGGSNGFHEQKAMETYDLQENKWVVKGSVDTAKVSQGMAALDGKIYYIGGCVGQQSVKECHVYDTETNTWSNIAPLQTGRYQAAVCAFNGLLYAIGGTDAWTCLNTTEIYDPRTNTWIYGPTLNVARRGAGCDVFNGTIYLAGGSDGQQSLRSTEILDLEKGWTVGPNLSIPRANVGVVSCENRLFAVGGFTGKKFLDTLEYLTSNSNASWCCYLPVENSVVADKIARRKSGSCESVDSNSNNDQTNRNIRGISVAVNGH